MTRRFLSLVVLLAFAPGCSCVKSALQPIILKSISAKDILEQVNSPQAYDPPFATVDWEVEEIFRDNLPDAYWDVSTASAPLTRSGAPARIRDAIICAEQAHTGAEETKCLEALYTDLQFPPPPKDPDEAAWARELDTIRMMENLGLAVRAAASFYHATQQPPITQDADKLLQGVTNGISGALAYQKVRKVQRHRERPVSALVMSGGAANGAYSAGATWYLLHRLNACKADAEALKAKCAQGGCTADQLRSVDQGCLNDRVDMVAGTSAGSLITLLVKDYFTEQENRRQRAMDMLLSSYTCSVNSDLYCVNDTNLYDLVDPSGRSKGLVRFDGIQKKLDDYVDETTFRSPTEYFASSVDYTSGRILHASSADPHDVPSVVDLRRSAVASIVEPAMAEPVDSVGQFHGTLVDGGVRSGLPMTTPLMRGAERAVVFVNSPLEATPLDKDPQNAGVILSRTLDLFSHQPIVGELHQAENQLVVKRISEFGRCHDRNAQATWIKDQSIDDLCSAAAWPKLPPPVLIAPVPRQIITQAPPPLIKAIPNAYQGVWIFQHNVLPKDISLLAPGASWRNLTQAGYQFDPKAMWTLFALGAIEAQEQCVEINRVLGWHLASGDQAGYCVTAEQLHTILEPLRERASTQCWTRKNEQRLCPK